jgi:hypothetical protein
MEDTDEYVTSIILGTNRWNQEKKFNNVYSFEDGKTSLQISID